MLILIAEAKTMTACARNIVPGLYAAHRAILESGAEDIMASLRDLPAAQLSGAVKIGAALAGRLRQMIYDFSNKSTGEKAIEAYSGVVFKALDYASLAPAQQRELDKGVRIISSLYGWLRPDDIIKPYRFDFTTKLAPGGLSFAAFWRDAVTDCLLQELHERGFRDVLDLLPGDAARCIDMKRVAAEARVWKVDFREVVAGSDRTPPAGRLKQLRGDLLRRIIIGGAEHPDDLVRIEGDDYYCEAILPQEGVVRYYTVPRSASCQ